MTDKEKKAIKDCDSIFIYLDDAMSEDSANDYRKSYKILKNLIEKQSKEIEELKYKFGVKYMDDILENSISKDKIKAKIEELDYNDIGNFERRCKQEVLQSLLEKE